MKEFQRKRISGRNRKNINATPEFDK